MSTEVIVMQHAYERQPLTVLDPVENSTDSDSDGGYGTPAEHFADDETDRPPTPPESAPPAAVATEAKSTAEEETVTVDSELRERIMKQVRDEILFMLFVKLILLISALIILTCYCKVVIMLSLMLFFGFTGGTLLQ